MPKNQNKTILFWWIIAVFLIACIAIIIIWGVNYYRQEQQRQAQVKPAVTQPEQAQPELPAKPQIDRHYFYAGQPRPQPDYPYQVLVLTNKGYLVGYVEEKKAPVWVGYRLFRVNSLQAPKRPEQFVVDGRTRSRVASSFFTGSGYDRGHLAPNFSIAICYGSAAQIQTFLMSNIIPQKPNLNRGIWNHLEQMEIRNYAQKLEEIWVLTGATFEDNKHLASGVNIPNACYKIIIDEQNKKPRILAFIIGQNIQGTENVTNFLTSVDMIEQRTGLDFLGDLPDDEENRLEAMTAGRLW